MSANTESSRKRSWLSIKPDRFTVLLVATVALATLLPARGAFVGVVDVVGRASILLLFFLHGASLSRKAVVASLAQWQLHLLVVASTFVLFPLIGLALRPLSGTLIDPSLYVGILFLCCLPSTVQSSIAFTSIAKGNVPAAVCAASASNLLGIVLTPLLTGLLLARHAAVTFDAWTAIVGSILLPFLLGQVAQRWIGPVIHRHKPKMSIVDRGSVLIMVYAAFGKAVTGGIWHTISPAQLALMIVLAMAILAVVMLTTRGVSRALGFGPADEAAIVFCGSKKSLVTGVPMASILFPGAAAGAIVLPLMTFHQIQLIVCAFLARAYERRARSDAAEPADAK